MDGNKSYSVKNGRLCNASLFSSTVKNSLFSRQHLSLGGLLIPKVDEKNHR